MALRLVPQSLLRPLSRFGPGVVSQRQVIRSFGTLKLLRRPQPTIPSRASRITYPALRVYSTPSTAKPEPEADKKKLLPKLPTALKHENIYTIPNMLTFGRILATPVIGYLVLHDQYAWATGMFLAAGLTDMIDGWIARKWNLQTVVGSVIDPAADKLLMTVMTTTLAMQGLIPIWLAVIILGRDVGLAISALYYRWISLPPPKTMARYWDFSLPSAEVRPTQISKINTALQIGLLGACTAHPLVGADIDLYITGFQYLVASTTVWSGLSYVFSNNAVKILNKPDGKGDDLKG